MTAPVKTSQSVALRSGSFGLPPRTSTKTSKNTLPSTPRHSASIADDSGTYLRTTPSVPNISIEPMSAIYDLKFSLFIAVLLFIGK